MTDTQRLVARARELAALARSTYPGEWSRSSIAQMFRYASKHDGPWYDEDFDEDDGEFLPMEWDAELVSVSPEMASLLGKLADALEDISVTPRKNESVVDAVDHKALDDRV